MGFFDWFSSTTETKSEVDGGIINEVKINEPISLDEKELMIMIFIIMIIKVIELIYMIFKVYQNKLKRKFERKRVLSSINLEKVSN
jgi:hypothetical protein